MRADPMRRACLVTFALALALAGGCGSASVDGGGTETGVGGFDAAILVPPQDSGGGPDAAAPADAGRDAAEPRDTGDGPPPDAPAPPDGTAPDGGRDAAAVDAQGCGACPPERPLCEGGRCICTPGTCGAGTYCDAGDCVACTIDRACGPSCLDCEARGQRCAASGEGCAECGDGLPACSAGFFCDGGLCAACTVGAACGPECAPCPDDRPACVGGACTCTAEACGAGRWCTNGRCQDCVGPLACGPECVDCRLVGSGLCYEGVCACMNDDQCTADRWCDFDSALGYGECVPCAADDPLHCGATCAVCGGAAPVCVDGLCACVSDGDCGDGARCEAGECLPCADAAHCGADCVACPAERPLCDGAACVVCLTDGDCGAGSWCAAGTCQPCLDDDPQHCGAACLRCSGGAPTCSAGSCVCAPGSCPTGQACVDQACVPCNVPERCGPACAVCDAAAPFCAPDASRCVECLGDGDCSPPDVCRSSLSCGPACTAEGCASDLARDAKTCGASITIGRRDAPATAFFSGDTTNDGNNDDLGSFSHSSCWDAQDDNFYRIWLNAGDRIDVVLDPQTATFNSSLKLYRGTDCEGGSNGDDDLIGCYHQGGDGADDSFSYTATEDGWVTIVVDGRSGFDDEHDWGAYVLRVTLACATEGCCCD